MNNYLSILLDLTFGFCFLFAATKVLGKTQITNITMFDFVSALVMGELVGNALYSEKISIWQIGFAVLIWVALTLTIEILTQKFTFWRGFLEGAPSIIIRQGRIDRDAMKRNRLDFGQLQHLLRAKGVFRLKDVDMAVLETDGTVSVLLVDPPVSQRDMNMKPARAIAIPLIIDGQLLRENVAEAHLTERDVIRHIKVAGGQTVTDCLFAEFHAEEGVHLQLKK